MCFDREGRLLVAGWGGRTVWRFEKDGSLKTLASHWEGKKLNSPNDIVVRSDGQIYFTDPPGGLLNVGMVGDDLQRYLDISPVLRIANDGSLHMVTDEVVYPNGLCFSPDEKLLYINCSRERLIKVYDVNADGSVGNGRLFHKYTDPARGNPDGLKCDVAGNVWCTGPGGIWVHDPAGDPICRLKVPGHPTNLGFGDPDWRSLYVTTIGNVVRTRLNIAGVAGW
jgi:gluconolactonase